MTTNNMLWIAMAAYGVHMLEEFFYDWKNWANNILGLKVDWPGFYLTNAIVLFLGIACAQTGMSAPWFSLAFPALMLINAFFFHVLPCIGKKKFSPGLITALILFFPIGIRSFRLAIQDGVSTADVLLAFLTGAVLMATPVLLIKTKHLKVFQQA